jgi:hypothetical protein
MWRKWHSGVVVTASVLVGFAIALTSTYRSAMLWPVWAALAASVCGVAGVVGVYGSVTWQALSRARPLPWGKTWLPTLIIGGSGVLVVLITELLAARAGTGWRGDLLALITMVGGGCAGIAMFGVRATVKAQTTRADDLPGLEETVVELVRLRRLLQRLSAALGALVALATLTLGVAVLLSDNQPPGLVVVYGAAGSVVVGSFHATVAATIRAQGEHVAGLIFDTATPSDAAEVVDRLEQRARLEQLIGVHRTLFSDLQSAIPVLGPIIAAATVLLPH